VTAEPIAEVVADIRGGRARHVIPDAVVNTLLSDRARAPQPVVDATAIYRSLVERPDINLYDDFPQVVSPWDEAMLGYVNEHGNVLVLQVHQELWGDRKPWETSNPVEWDRVRWLIETSVWVGGKSKEKPLPTQGPAHLLQTAVYDDGSAADLHWVSLLGHDDVAGTWEMPLAVLNAALNFLACSNVEVAEPKRPFPVRQRLRKTRVQVQTIVVRPPGKRRVGSSAEARPMDELDTQVTSVRGSFGRYGPQFGTGLLFGKYAGKFWRPAHARGRGEAQPRDYVLKPGGAA
jgi:hypothetical protein